MEIRPKSHGSYFLLKKLKAKKRTFNKIEWVNYRIDNISRHLIELVDNISAQLTILQNKIKNSYNIAVLVRFLDFFLVELFYNLNNFGHYNSFQLYKKKWVTSEISISSKIL